MHVFQSISLLPKATHLKVTTFLVGDNGSRFSYEKSIFSSLYHPASNGQAERQVDIPNKFLKKNVLDYGPFVNLDKVVATSRLSYRSIPSRVKFGVTTHLGREFRNCKCRSYCYIFAREL